jgi:DNA topoisomerase-1
VTARELHATPPVEGGTRRKRAVVAAIRTAAAELGNTPAVTRRSYVHPRVIEGYLDGGFEADYADALEDARRDRPRELRLHEGATLGFLRADVERDGDDR